MPRGKPAASSWPPRWLTKVPPRTRSDGDELVQFAEAYCRVTKDSFAGPTGMLLKFRPWQKHLAHALLARRPDGRLKHRRALIGMPRKNGKSAWGSCLALHGLFLGPDGAEVYSCAGDREQARIVFGMARRMVELDEELSGMAKLYRDAIEVPSTGGIYRVLSAEAYTKEGLSPTRVVFDEVHVQPNDELWNVMNLGSGARHDPLVVGITTAGSRTDTHGQDSLCYRLYQHGQRLATGEEHDPSFFFAWWEPKQGADCDHSDPKVWAEANPGYDDLVDSEDFASSLPSTPEAEFRTKRTNVFVVASESALPYGAWDRCADPAVQPSGTVDLFLDGAWSGDCTALVGCTHGPTPHLFVVGLWERPIGDLHWRVPIGDVKARIHWACIESGWQVRRVGADPYRWQQTMQDLEREGVSIVEFPTNSVPRIVPAWKQFYDRVMDRTLTHSGEASLARHVENMRLKIDASGPRPVKEHKMSGRHIDLGICAVAALALVSVPASPERRALAVWA